MLASLPGFLEAYGWYLAAVAVLCVVLCYFSDTFFKNLKKGIVVFVILFSLAAGYEMITGKSFFELPGSIDKKLSEYPQDVEKGHRYYKSSRERYGGAMPDND